MFEFGRPEKQLWVIYPGLSLSFTGDVQLKHVAGVGGILNTYYIHSFATLCLSHTDTYRTIKQVQLRSTERKKPSISPCDLLGEVAAVGVSKDGSMGTSGP